MAIGNWIFLLLLFTAMFLSVHQEKLTMGGAMAGGVIACLIFLGAGFTGVAMIGLFFLLGTLATSWKIIIKENLGAAEINKGRRTASQVIANGGVAGLAGLVSWLFTEHREVIQWMMAAALSSATADTLSSELGTVYGKKFYNITGFQNGSRGENGVVSLEGTLIGLGGSLLIALIYSIGFGLNKGLLYILIAGTIGNITDSILGATLERKNFIGNDAVNFINTFIAALAAWVLALLF